jgi:hypothetical protein
LTLSDWAYPYAHTEGFTTGETMPASRMPDSWDGTISTSQDRKRPPRPSGRWQHDAGLVADMTGAPQAQTRADAAGPPARTSHRPGVRLTGRGGVLAILVISLAGAFAASAWHLAAFGGACYVGACAFTAWTVRRGQLLPIVVTPPMLFGVAVVCAQAVTSSKGMLSAVEGTLVMLGDMAPWLFAGTLLGLVIALARGLAGNLRALGQGLRGLSADGDLTRPPGSHQG